MKYALEKDATLTKRNRDTLDPNSPIRTHFKRMNSVSRFLFWIYISISDAVGKGYEYMESLIAQLVNRCSQKSVMNEENVEVLNYKEMDSKRVFVAGLL